MLQISQNLQSIYHSYRILPFILCVGVIIDYSLTFYFAGSIETVLQYEFSPTLTYAIRHNMVIPYLVFTIFFYYVSAYIVLKFLADSEIYYIGVFIILLMSIAHVMGGLSWYVLNVNYSNTVLVLSLISVVITITVFGYEIFKQA